MSARNARRVNATLSDELGCFIQPTRKRPRHQCADHLPSNLSDAVEERWLWVCTCGRRWRLVTKGTGSPPLCQFAEGVGINGPDGSQYWRPFLTRFVGRIGA